LGGSGGGGFGMRSDSRPSKPNRCAPSGGAPGVGIGSPRGTPGTPGTVSTGPVGCAGRNASAGRAERLEPAADLHFGVVAGLLREDVLAVPLRRLELLAGAVLLRAQDRAAHQCFADAGQARTDGLRGPTPAEVRRCHASILPSLFSPQLPPAA
jgi:hypothetical protein